MAVYDFAKGGGIGQACRVLDANDRQIPYVLKCNVVTGEVWRYAYPLRRGPDERFETVHDFHPAPLIFELMGDGEVYLKDTRAT